MAAGDSSRRVVAAVDIGASGGRVMAGVIRSGRVTLDPIHRFSNGVVELDGHLRWNITGLFGEVLHGLAQLAAKYPDVESIGIDTWAVDYGLLDVNGALLAEPISYRDARTDAAVTSLHASVGAADLFAINGLQFLPFNTVYQLVAEQAGPLWPRAAHVVLLPDLLAFWLTGELRTEYTNATTTGLVDAHTGNWSVSLLDRVGVSATMLPEIEQPGARRGLLLPAVAARLGFPSDTAVTTVASHDTASAVVGVPATGPDVAYVACGTWSLVGVERSSPLVTAAAAAQNFTNEGGVDGRTRFLRNVGGLWLLQETLRTWSEAGEQHDLADLLDAAGALPPGGPVFDVDDPSLIAPDNMPDRIGGLVGRAGGLMPATRAGVVRCILDSLTQGYARTIEAAAALSDVSVQVVHIVGGGSQNWLMCQLTADATGLPVVAGPIEATALGNVLVQARAIGAAPGNLEALRALGGASTPLTRYLP